MVINVLIFTPDGKQRIEQREVGEEWFSPAEQEKAAQETEE